jgi:hypothetical protein
MEAILLLNCPLMAITSSTLLLRFSYPFKPIDLELMK